MKTIKIMQFIMLLAAGLYFNSAHAVLIDISGISADYGVITATVPIPEDEDIAPGFQMAFSFEVEHYGGSWLNDTKITARNSFYGINYTVLGSDCGFTSGQTGIGICDFELTIAEDSSVDFGDTWTFEFEDTFPDPVSPQYTFLANSYIGWGDDLETVRNNHVSEPAVLLLMSLGLLGIVALRRQQ